MTLLMMFFGHNPKGLGKALALYGAAAPAGGTAGMFLGGVFTERASWPWALTIYPVGSAIGLASLTALATSHGAGVLGGLPALTDGFSAAFLAAAGIAAAGALATLTLMRGKPGAAGVAVEPVAGTEGAERTGQLLDKN